jgi:hypothetical protein
MESPVTDAVALRTIDSEQFTGNILWSPAIATDGEWAGRFMGGEQYTAFIYLEPKRGFTFGDSPLVNFVLDGVDPNNVWISYFNPETSILQIIFDHTNTIWMHGSVDITRNGTSVSTSVPTYNVLTAVFTPDTTPPPGEKLPQAITFHWQIWDAEDYMWRDIAIGDTFTPQIAGRYNVEARTPGFIPEFYADYDQPNDGVLITNRNLLNLPLINNHAPRTYQALTATFVPDSLVTEFAPGTIAYQWFFDGDEIIGATASTLPANRVLLPGTYTVEVSARGFAPARPLHDAEVTVPAGVGIKVGLGNATADTTISPRNSSIGAVNAAGVPTVGATDGVWVTKFDGQGNQNSFVQFSIDFAADANLSDFENISFDIDAVSGDLGSKKFFVLASNSSFVGANLSFSGNEVGTNAIASAVALDQANASHLWFGDGAVALSNVVASNTVINTDIPVTLIIDSARATALDSASANTIFFVIYSHMGATGDAGTNVGPEMTYDFIPTSYRIKNIKFSANALISAATASVTTPVNAANPANATVAAGSNFTVENTVWQIGPGWGGHAGEFIGGNQYRAQFTLRANAGYSFTAAPTITVAGATVAIEDPAPSAPRATVLVTATFAETPVVNITSAAVTLTAPANGATASTAAPALVAQTPAQQFTAGTVAWTTLDDATWVSHAGNFIGGRQYRATFTLTRRNTGAIFVGTNVLVNGVAATTATVGGTPSGNTVEVVATFTATGSPVGFPIEFNAMVAPANGATAVLTAPTISVGTGFTVVTTPVPVVTWTPALVGGVFAAGTVYTATFDLTPSEGFTFAGITHTSGHVSVRGAANTTYEVVNTSNLRVSARFAATAGGAPAATLFSLDEWIVDNDYDVGDVIAGNLPAPFTRAGDPTVTRVATGIQVDFAAGQDWSGIDFTYAFQIGDILVVEATADDGQLMLQVQTGGAWDDQRIGDLVNLSPAGAKFELEVTQGNMDALVGSAFGGNTPTARIRINNVPASRSMVITNVTVTRP